MMRTFKLFTLLAALAAGCTMQDGLDDGDTDEAEPAPQSDVTTIAAIAPRVKTRAVKLSDLGSRSTAVQQAVAPLFQTAQTGDFDTDGTEDKFVLHGKDFTITLGNGKVFKINVPQADQIFSAVDSIGLGARNRTSFVLSVYTADDWYNRAPQVLVYNDAGIFRTRVLTGVNIIGRDVQCTKFPAMWGYGLCMFASYGRDGKTYSTLLEIAPDGTASSVTQQKGLPWSSSGMSVPSGSYINGKYMMGFTFVDLNGDTKPDLVGAGQHSQMVYSLMTGSGTSYAYSPIKWFDDQDEYMDVSALGKLHSDFPCVYTHIESPEASRTPRGDFLTCFNKGTQTWDPQPMPGQTSDGGTIKQLVMDAKDARMVDVGDAIYIASKAKFGDNHVEDIFLEVRRADGTPPIIDPLLRSEVFDPAFYLRNYGDLTNAFGPTNYDRATAHWLSNGIKEGRRGSQEFWSQTYLARYADLRQAFGTDYEAAIRHYINHGIAEGRDGN